MRNRVSALLVVGALASALTAAPAVAHEGDPNYRSAVTAISPQPSGLDAEVVNYDDSLHVTNGTGETLLVAGYRGEPYVRILPSGEVQVNQDSPSFYLNQDRYAETAVPASADPRVEPDWRTVNESGEYTWHDHRIHWMGEGLPPQVTDEDEATEIYDWKVPVSLGGERVEIDGTLEWIGPPEDSDSAALPIALGSLGVVAVLGAAALVIVRRRRRRGVNADEVREAW